MKTLGFIKRSALCFSFLSVLLCSHVNAQEELPTSDIAFRSAVLLVCLNITEFGHSLSDFKDDLDLQVITGPLAEEYPDRENALLFPSSDSIIIVETKKEDQYKVCSVYLYSKHKDIAAARTGLELFLDAAMSPFIKQSKEIIKSALVSYYLWPRDDFYIGVLLTTSTKKKGYVSITSVASTYRTLEPPLVSSK